VKNIRRATRKRHSSEEKIRIVLDGLRGVTQPPAPFHVTPRGFAGPNLLAMIPITTPVCRIRKPAHPGSNEQEAWARR
jgi:hypothetical protein